jgi:hypothetical protein
MRRFPFWDRAAGDKRFLLAGVEVTPRGAMLELRRNLRYVIECLSLQQEMLCGMQNTVLELENGRRSPDIAAILLFPRCILPGVNWLSFKEKLLHRCSSASWQMLNRLSCC